MKKQKGFMGYVYLAVALFLAAAGVAVVMKYNSAITRADKAEQDAKEWKEAHDVEVAEANRLNGDLNEARKTAAARTKERDVSNSKLAATNAKLEALERSNPTAAANLRTPIDPDVRSLRRLNAGCSADTALPCTPGRPSADSATPAEGRDDKGTHSGERSSS